MAPTVTIDYTGQRESKICSNKGLTQVMGKTRKFSRGHSSSGFIADFRNATDGTAESEGFGCSGRADVEDSRAPKRKCISLNADSYDRFGVPVQTLSFSMLSQSERKDLELRLRSELEQVRNLQKKIASLSSDVVVLSPYSDIHSCSDGQKRPPLESSHRSVKQSKQRAPPGRNGPRTKPVAEKRLESVKKAVPPSASTAVLMKQCETLLNRLMSHQFGWVFNTPVDAVKLNIPDYFDVIKHPMDLGTIKNKVISGEYMSPSGFAEDVRLTFSNAMTYNPRGNDAHFMAETLSKYFEVRWKPIEKKLGLTIETVVPSRQIVHVESDTANKTPPAKKKKIASIGNNFKQETAKRIMSDVEKHKLSTELETLLAELPESIIDFLKEQSFPASQTGEDEIEIDIDALSDDTLFKLRKLLDDYLLDKQKKQEKAEPCEIELHNESGFSNSSLPPCKASDDAMDEDIDIVGNDPPNSSYPPVVIEKDAVLGNSKCSSSSGSSSESRSSTSDSDSASSFGGETDGPKVPASTTKEISSSGANLEQKCSNLGDPDVGNHSLNGSSQVEQDSDLKSFATEADGHQEGESAPSERQVSPDKLYRAALLRSRFADTILKAQEKTLDKGEKQDPEKLRLEREELERRIREEKSRLQAEARAAEEARRKAEAEAAAEARRKRELEREAARQALQKMEKTVDINENSQFLKDLELLGSAPEEPLESFIEETSPDLSQDGLGSFKLQGSNPLEQLGLYIKADDDEEEEGEPQSAVPNILNDPEEGEID